MCQGYMPTQISQGSLCVMVIFKLLNLTIIVSVHNERLSLSIIHNIPSIGNSLLSCIGYISLAFLIHL